MQIDLTPSLLARFWARIDSSGGPDACWPWMRGTSNGYGTMQPNTRLHAVGTHVVSWVIHHGPIPEGMFVCHSCDVRYAPGDFAYRRCGNPKHLFLGTRNENTADMVAKGRQARGERHASRTHPERLRRGDNHPARLHPERLARGAQSGMNTHPEKRSRGEANGFARLTAERVMAIRADHAAGTAQIVLAARYEVSQQTISLVVRRVSWRHI